MKEGFHSSLAVEKAIPMLSDLKQPFSFEQKILWLERVQLGDSSVIAVVSAEGLGLEEPLPR